MQATIHGNLPKHDNVDILMVAARAFGTLGDAQKSEMLLRRIITLQPSYVAAYGALASLYVRQGRLDAALTEFENAARRDPHPVAAFTMAGMVLQAQGKPDEARE